MPIGTIRTTSLLRLQAHRSESRYPGGVTAQLIRSEGINFLLTNDTPEAWRRVPGFIALGDERKQAFQQAADELSGRADMIAKDASPMDTETTSTVALIKELAYTVNAMA